MEVPPPTELRDSGIILRPWRLADVPRVTEICQDNEIARWTLVPSPYQEQHARIWIEQTIRDWADRKHATFAITEADSGEVVGAIGLRLHGDYAVNGNIGYWVAEEARGRGIASTALRLLTRWGADQVGLSRLQLVTDPENIASQKVAERAGFSREGILRGYIERHGERHDCVMFSLLAGELEDGNRG
ncbi:MAG: GNAT family N-acetyltransferase [Chloroflexota bacterium]|nr:GNAT family N-acetyltransferase [Chloroflexota bacterium]